MFTAFLSSLLPQKITPLQLGSAFIFLIILRLLADFSANTISSVTPIFLFFETLHTGLFFFLTFLFISFFLSYIAKIALQKSIGIMLWGFLLTLFPPIIDRFISRTFFGGQEFSSYYLFDSFSGLIERFFTLFGDMPHDGITYGTRIMIFLAITLITFVTYHQTRDPLNTVLAALGSYTIFFILSSFPTLITFVITAFSQETVEAHTVAKYFFTPSQILGNQISGFRSALNVKMSMIYILITITTLALLFFTLRRSKCLALLSNVRPLQIIYHIGLLFIGMGLAYLFTTPIIISSFFSSIALMILMLSIVSAWISAVAFNDIADIAIDKISNPHRPLPRGTLSKKEMIIIGLVFFALSLILTLMITPFATLFILSYHAFSWLYNMPPYRIKRIPGLASLFSAFASLMIVFVGYTVITPSHDLYHFPVNIAILLVLTFTLSLPIKDFKDLLGDTKDHVWTLPVLFGEPVARIMIGVGIFISYLSSVFFLHAPKLFLPALLFGSLSFWILAYKKSDTFLVSPNRIIPLIFITTFLYGCLLVWLVFF